MKYLIAPLVFFLCTVVAHAQQISKEELTFLTPEWTGERFEDGRPRVPDDILARMLLALHCRWAKLLP